MTVTEDSDIFFFPIYTEKARGNYHETIVEPVQADRISETTGTELGFPSAHVWGNKVRVFDERNWTISPNDILVFYTRDNLLGFASPSAVQKLDHDTAVDLCREIWSYYDEDDPYDYIMYSSTFHEPAISREELRSALGYADLHQQARRAGNGAKQNLSDAFGGLQTFFETATGVKPEHPLISHLRDEGTVPVRKFTAPPDYWLSSLEYRAVSFSEEHRDRWERVAPGEVVIFHSQAEPSNEALPNQPNGLIGAGIVGQKKYTKSAEEDWWWDEVYLGKDFPLLIGFDRLFVTGQVGRIDFGIPISEKDDDAIQTELDALTSSILDFERVERICEDVAGIGFPTQSALATFRDQDGGIDVSRPRALIRALAGDLTEISPVNVVKPFEGTLSRDILSGLYFPEDNDEEILGQVEAALRSGKHLVLTGPPGTGKTEIARQVGSYLVEEYPYLYTGSQMTTATADWSTFDTVGGYMPEETADDGELSFTPGIVLNRLKSTRTGVQSSEPIVIDELNRADIDKAFGQLFTLLSGQSVQLPYTKDGQEIELLTAEELDELPGDHQYIVPKSWRIFATMNTYDKTSLYEMSYAFMRRFAFIRVSTPELPDDDQDLEDLMIEYINTWDDIDWDRRDDVPTEVGRVWRATNQAVEDRAIGPAIVRDILGYVLAHESEDLERRLTEAVISYIFPQLEGVPKREQIVRRIADVRRVDEGMIDSAARDMLQVAIVESNE